MFRCENEFRHHNYSVSRLSLSLSNAVRKLSCCCGSIKDPDALHCSCQTEPAFPGHSIISIPSLLLLLSCCPFFAAAVVADASLIADVAYSYTKRFRSFQVPPLGEEAERLRCLASTCSARGRHMLGRGSAVAPSAGPWRPHHPGFAPEAAGPMTASKQVLSGPHLVLASCDATLLIADERREERCRIQKMVQCSIFSFDFSYFSIFLIFFPFEKYGCSFKLPAP